MWKNSPANKHFRIELVSSLIALTLILLSFTRYLQFIEFRQGAVLTDPILSQFNPVDLTWIIFGLIYLSIIIAVIFFIRDTPTLLLAVQCYCLLVIIRIVTLYLVPLEPPAGIIPLNDPFVQLFGKGQILEKDLFFSGHTATLFLFFLIAKEKILRLIFLISTICVGLALILQHVHYTIDVAAAPLFSIFSFKLILNVKSNKSSALP